MGKRESAKDSGGVTERDQFWLDHEAAQAASGQTAKDYAATQGVSLHAFYQARKRLRTLGLLAPAARRETPSRNVRKRKPSFTQIQITPEVSPAHFRIGMPSGIVLVGCWAHARRKFDEALRGQPRAKKKGAKRTAKESKARQALTQIQALYRIERDLREATPEERHRVRQERSRPVIEKLREWLDASLESVPVGSIRIRRPVEKLLFHQRQRSYVGREASCVFPNSKGGHLNYRN